MPPAPATPRAVYIRRRLVAGLVGVGLVAGGVVAAQTIADDDTDRAGGATTPSVSVVDTSFTPTSTTLGAPGGPPASSAAPPSVDTAPAGVPGTGAVDTSTVDTSAVATTPATPDAGSTATSVATTSSTTSSSAQTTGAQAGELRTDPTAPVLDAAAYGVYDWGAGTWLTATNADAHRPVGSIMKLLTAEVVMAAGDSSKAVTVPDLSLDPSESAIGLYPGEQLPRDVLLRAMLIVSANDAADTLALDVGGTQERFVAMMNAAARELGLADTSAANPSGLDEGDAGSTVRDVVTLAAHLLHDETFRATVARPTATLHGQTFPSTNELLGVYSGADGIKTGSTTKAGYGVVASATRAGRTLIVAVLGAPTDAARFMEAASLLDWAFARGV